MSVVTDTSPAIALSSAEGEDDAATPMKNAGAYLKELRRACKLSQGDVADAIQVGRGTIERLEAGDDRVSVGTVLRVLKMLEASPWHYYDLATNPSRGLSEIRRQRVVMRGIVAYMQALAARRHAQLSMLEEVEGSLLFSTANDAEGADSLSAHDVLLALMYLDAPLADLAPIFRASSNHEAIGRQQAEARGTFATVMGESQPHEQIERQSLPSLDAIVARVSALLRYSHDLPTLLRHELSRVDADLKRYRALLVLAVGYIKAEP
jgi:transcriptional regulator with XRE-family HTH domain